VSSQVKLPLIKTSDNRMRFTSTVNENKVVKNQYTKK